MELNGENIAFSNTASNLIRAIFSWCRCLTTVIGHGSTIGNALAINKIVICFCLIVQQIPETIHVAQVDRESITSSIFSDFWLEISCHVFCWIPHPISIIPAPSNFIDPNRVPHDFKIRRGNLVSYRYSGIMLHIAVNRNVVMNFILTVFCCLIRTLLNFWVISFGRSIIMDDSRIQHPTSYGKSTIQVTFLSHNIMVNSCIEEEFSLDTRLLLNIICIGQSNGLVGWIQKSICHYVIRAVLKFNSWRVPKSILRRQGDFCRISLMYLVIRQDKLCVNSKSFPNINPLRQITTWRILQAHLSDNTTKLSCLHLSKRSNWWQNDS